MERKAVCGITLALLILGMLTLSRSIQKVKAEPKMWTVDDDGPADFHTIQEAINAANLGDTIYVYEGTYRENVVLNKTVSLVGEDKRVTVIDGSGRDNAVTITANNTKISGFRIENRGSHLPVDLHSGIQAINSTGNKITDNIVTNNAGFGIVLENSDHNVLLYNLVTNNTEMGIYLEYSSHNSLLCNKVLTNERDGIRLFRSFNNSVIGNTIINNENGLWLDLSSNNNVVSNTITDNLKIGVWLASSSNNFITNNNVANNGFDGIDISFSSSNNDIIGNTIAGNKRGIVLFFAQDKNPSDNSIYHNNFVDNQDQAYINVLFRNNWDDGYPSGGNYWSDYTGVDLYSGPYQNVTGGDGIGDAPYVIDENNIDRYPLMKPWKPPIPSDINKDGIVDIADIVLAALAFGSYPEHPRWNPIADIDQDGKVDIDDIVLIATNFGKKYIV